MFGRLVIVDLSEAFLRLADSARTVVEEIRRFAVVAADLDDIQVAAALPARHFQVPATILRVPASRRNAQESRPRPTPYAYGAALEYG